MIGGVKVHELHHRPPNSRGFVDANTPSTAHELETVHRLENTAEDEGQHVTVLPVAVST
jgi:hypothetical protein